MGWPQPRPRGVHSERGSQLYADPRVPGDSPPCSMSRVPCGPSRLGGWGPLGVGRAQPASYPRYRRSCGGAGTGGAWARRCRWDATSAATRPRPCPLMAPPARSCCSPGAVAAMGPARTPWRRPAWPATSLDWPSVPSEAPGSPGGAGLGSRERALLDNPQLMPKRAWRGGSRTVAPPSSRPPVRWSEGQGSPSLTCRVGKLFCKCIPSSLCVCAPSVGGNTCPPTIKSWRSDHQAHPGDGAVRGGWLGPGLPVRVRREKLRWGPELGAAFYK